MIDPLYEYELPCNNDRAEPLTSLKTVNLLRAKLEELIHVVGMLENRLDAMGER